MTTNRYEVEIDKLLAQKDPDFYEGLIKVLSEFQNELISEEVIANGTYREYTSIIKRIAEQDSLALSMSYNLQDSLQQLGDGLNNMMRSVESSLIANKYLNSRDSKDFVFGQKISEMAKKGVKPDRSALANLMLEVYDENDFELPLIRLKFFRFLDPNSDFIVYKYIGRPSRD